MSLHLHLRNTLRSRTQLQKEIKSPFCTFLVRREEHSMNDAIDCQNKIYKTIGVVELNLAYTYSSIVKLEPIRLCDRHELFVTIAITGELRYSLASPRKNP